MTIGSRGDDGPTKEEYEDSREELAKGERERGRPPPVEHNGHPAHEQTNRWSCELVTALQRGADEGESLPPPACLRPNTAWGRGDPDVDNTSQLQQTIE